jgi:hypothetical protein
MPARDASIVDPLFRAARIARPAFDDACRIV